MSNEKQGQLYTFLNIVLKLPKVNSISHAVSAESMFNLLDAAKTDFPIDDDLIDDDHIFSPREELLRYHKLEHKRAVWFNKWFGATKQQ